MLFLAPRGRPEIAQGKRSAAALGTDSKIIQALKGRQEIRSKGGKTMRYCIITFRPFRAVYLNEPLPRVALRLPWAVSERPLGAKERINNI
jgi:hypothetical protein